MATETDQTDGSGSVFVQKGRLEAFFQVWPPLVLLSFVWIGIVILIAIVAPMITPYDSLALDVRARLQPPILFGGSLDHVFGTDQLGRDIFSRVLMSIRVSITLALSATTISAFIGIVLGFTAAHFRGVVDQVILTIVDAQLAMPFMVIAIAILAFVGNSLTVFILMLGLFGWEQVTRIARGLAISANAQGYASTAKEIGASPWRVYMRHILPNTSATIVVVMTLNIPGVILLESSLSFLGIGLQPPEASLGNMVGYGREYIQTAPWMMLAPAAIIVMITLSVTIIGDWLRDRIDPTLK